MTPVDGLFIGLVVGMMVGCLITLSFTEYDPNTDRLFFRKRK